MTRQVLVYLDTGVGASTFQQLFTSLRASLSPASYSVDAIDHRYLIDKEWMRQTALLVIPGGRDIPYHTHLQGRGNQRIAEYVTGGGAYLGICAGGYYGAAYIEFEKGGALEVSAARELAFFPGKAIGPAYGLGQFTYESESGARSAQLSWREGACRVYFNGGCYFEHPEIHASVDVLARYEDLPGCPAAVVSCAVGKGQAILSGVHPESEVDASFESSRRSFWHYLIEQSLNNVNNFVL